MVKVVLVKFEVGEGNFDFYNRKLIFVKVWFECEIFNMMVVLECIEFGVDMLMEFD